jgi:hypothetical protein
LLLLFLRFAGLLMLMLMLMLLLCWNDGLMVWIRSDIEIDFDTGVDACV